MYYILTEEQFNSDYIWFYEANIKGVKCHKIIDYIKSIPNSKWHDFVKIDRHTYRMLSENNQPFYLIYGKDNGRRI